MFSASRRVPLMEATRSCQPVQTCLLGYCGHRPERQPAIARRAAYYPTSMAALRCSTFANLVVGERGPAYSDIQGVEKVNAMLLTRPVRKHCRKVNRLRRTQLDFQVKWIGEPDDQARGMPSSPLASNFFHHRPPTVDQDALRKRCI